MNSHRVINLLYICLIAVSINCNTAKNVDADANKSSSAAQSAKHDAVSKNDVDSKQNSHSKQDANATNMQKKQYVIQGNKRVPDDVIISLVSPVHDLDSNFIKNVLMDSNYFKQVTIRKINGKCHIRVVEFPVLKEVTYKVKNSVSLGKQWEALTGLKKRDFVSDQTIKSVEEILKSYYKTAEDTPYVEVESYSHEDAGNISLKFDVIVQKPKPVVKSKFIGINNLDPEELHDLLEKKVKPVFYLFSKQSIRIDALEQSKNKIIDYAKSIGYLDLEIKSMSVENIGKHKVLVVNLYEGKQYKVSDIKFNTPVKIGFSDTIKIGDIFNKYKLENVKDALERKLHEDGFINHQVSYDLDSKDSKVSITFKSEIKNPQVIHNINIIGNTRTYSSVILKRLTMSPGDIVSQREILRSKYNILRSGFCENVSIDKDVNENGVDLDVNVKEVNTGTILFKLSASLQRKIEYSFEFGYSDVNFLGKGKGFKADVHLARTARTVGLEISESHVNGKPISYILGFDMFFLPAVIDTSFSPNHINFNTRSDKVSDLYDVVASRIQEAGLLSKTDNKISDKYNVQLAPTAPKNKKDDDKNKYWSENDTGVLTKTSGIDLRAGGSITMNNHRFSLVINPNFKQIKIKDEHDDVLVAGGPDTFKSLDNNKYKPNYIKRVKKLNNKSEAGHSIFDQKKGYYTKGIGITRFFDKHTKNFDEYKAQIDTRFGYGFALSNLNDDVDLSFNGNASIVLGQSNYVKFTGNISTNKTFNDKYVFNVHFGGGHVMPIHNYSWFDNFKPGEIGVSGFRMHGPRDVLRFNSLGGKHYLSAGCKFTAPFILPKTFRSKWFMFLDVGSVWNSGLKSQQVPTALCKMRNWDYKTADIAQNSYKPVASCGFGMNFKLGFMRLGFAVHYPLLGYDSPLNSCDTLKIGMMS